jgi:hypothetical protein
MLQKYRLNGAIIDTFHSIDISDDFKLAEYIMNLEK